MEEIRVCSYQEDSILCLTKLKAGLAYDLAFSSLMCHRVGHHAAVLSLSTPRPSFVSTSVVEYDVI